VAGRLAPLAGRLASAGRPLPRRAVVSRSAPPPSPLAPPALPQPCALLLLMPMLLPTCIRL
jgi:hypothetical protein